MFLEKTVTGVLPFWKKKNMWFNLKYVDISINTLYCLYWNSKFSRNGIWSSTRNNFVDKSFRQSGTKTSENSENPGYFWFFLFLLVTELLTGKTFLPGFFCFGLKQFFPHGIFPSKEGNRSNSLEFFKSFFMLVNTSRWSPGCFQARKILKLLTLFPILYGFKAKMWLV